MDAAAQGQPSEQKYTPSEMSNLQSIREIREGFVKYRVRQLLLFLLLLAAFAVPVSAEEEKTTPVISLQDKTADYTGEPISMGAVSVSGTMARVTVIYFTDAACTQKTGESVGALTEGGAPAAAGTYYVVASVEESSYCHAGSSAPAKLTIVAPDPAEAKITYELDGGRNTSRNPASVRVGSNPVPLQNAQRDGYIFLGWYADPEFRQKVTEVSTDTGEDLTLYAKWIPYFNQKNYSGATYNGYPFAEAGCGPTSCAMLSREDPVYVGQWFTENGYATDGGSHPDGVTAYLESVGRDPVRCDYDTWYAAMSEGGRIGIVLMQTGAYTAGEHFIVVTEVDGEGNAYVLDPAYYSHNGWSNEVKTVAGEEFAIGFPLTAEQFAAQIVEDHCWYIDWDY